MTLIMKHYMFLCTCTVQLQHCLLFVCTAVAINHVLNTSALLERMASLLKDAKGSLKDVLRAEKFIPNKENLRSYALKVRADWNETSGNGFACQRLLRRLPWTVYRIKPTGKYCL